ncbi:hypothetical protein AB0K93_16730 [Streptomyces sp. NPDC052676]|uniref:hypothetical protein n=1 Tax=Streptomyces sp. NPDC052676 TaxID=3154953 RepID=UPI0034195EE5
MILLLKGSVTAGEPFASWDDHAAAWHRHVLLWRSAFDEAQWTDFALSLSLRRTWDERGRELWIALRDASWTRRGPRT